MTWTMGKRDTTTAALRRAADRDPDRVYLDFAGESHTYAEVTRLVDRLATGLREHGVRTGDTVVTMLDNNVEAVAAWYAINLAGGINVPINTALRGEFLRHVVGDAGARVVLAEQDYVERLAGVASGVPDLGLVVHRGIGPVARVGSARSLPLEDLVLDADTPPPDTAQPSDVTCLIYTAGTTGPSKGCMISHNYAANLARHGLRSNARTVDEIVWSPLPLFHLNATATKVLATALLGGTVSIYPRFSVSNFWGEIRRSGASIASLLGAMIPLIAQADDTEASLACVGQLRHVSGAPFPEELQTVFRERFGVQTCGSNVYGLTEAAPVTSLAHGEPHPAGSAGRRNDDFDVRIVDEDGNEVPDGQMGEVIVRPNRPDVMFAGYWQRPVSTVAATSNLWFHTGDYGRFDEDGFFWFLDRKKDYLRRRGENISSVELEQAFRTHPAISEVAAHAVFSELGEDDVKVTVVLREDAEPLTEEGLCWWAVDHVPYYAVPRYIEFRKELPKNALGRVLKYQLRDEGCTETTWDRETAGLTVPPR